MKCSQRPGKNKGRIIEMMLYVNNNESNVLSLLSAFPIN